MNKTQSITTAYVLNSLLFPYLLPAQVQVPDQAFRQVIEYHGLKCDSLGFIINSEDAAEMEKLKFDDSRQFKTNAITDLSAIKAFTSLEYLDCCGSNNLNKLDFSLDIHPNNGAREVIFENEGSQSVDLFDALIHQVITKALTETGKISIEGGKALSVEAILANAEIIQQDHQYWFNGKINAYQ